MILAPWLRAITSPAAAAAESLRAFDRARVGCQQTGPLLYNRNACLACSVIFYCHLCFFLMRRLNEEKLDVDIPSNPPQSDLQQQQDQARHLRDQHHRLRAVERSRRLSPVLGELAALGKDLR